MRGFNVFDFDVQTNDTEQLANYAANLRYEDLPPEVIERVKLITLHTIGCSLAASGLKQAKSAEKIASAIGGGEHFAATSWQSGKKMSPPAAGFVNGTLSDMLDWEDCSYTGHPSAALVPAAVAMGEETKANGREYMAAYVAGYEVYQRIASCVGTPFLGFDPKFGHALPNWPIFASSVATAKYFKLDAQEMNRTLGMTILFHKQLSNIYQATMSEAYHYEFGHCCQNGMQAAMCVKEGVAGLLDSMDIPYAYIEHQGMPVDRSYLTKGLGERYMLMEMLIKHWPSNMWIQTTLEITYDLTRENKIDPDKIKEIIVDPPAKYRMHHRPEGYASIMDAEFSIPYCVAACILEDKPGPNWYSEKNLRNPHLLELASKVKGGDKLPGGDVFSKFVETEGKGFPDRRVTIQMEDGTIYERTQSLHKGHPAQMMTKDEFHELFMHQASFALQSNQAEGLFNFIMDLENCDNLSKIGTFFQR